MRIIYSIICLAFLPYLIFAGNPDRQGESGAAELNFNPWARSAGLNSLNTASISGLEAMRLNIAGLSRMNNGEVLLSNSRIYEGTGLMLNGGGFATKIGENGAFGVTLASLSFGDIPITTAAQPEGTGGNFAPNFFNIGIGYSYMYANKISVGLLVRGISEALPDVSAFGFAIDAGVQYVSGEKDNFRLGISLRNIGSPMKFGGQGLAFQVDNPDPDFPGTQFQLTAEQRAEGYQLPSLLNIGLSYDFYFSEISFLRTVGNFTSNAYSRDEVGAGLELSFVDKVMLRGSYKYQLQSSESNFGNDVYTGFAGGFSVITPFKKGSDQKIGVDYAYRTTNPFKGTHNVTLRLEF